MLHKLGIQPVSNQTWVKRTKNKTTGCLSLLKNTNCQEQSLEVLGPKIRTDLVRHEFSRWRVMLGLFWVDCHNIWIKEFLDNSTQNLCFGALRCCCWTSNQNQRMVFHGFSLSLLRPMDTNYPRCMTILIVFVIITSILSIPLTGMILGNRLT